jgi:UDPglucose--hexose-1-phosphate uridylyltransferase
MSELRYDPIKRHWVILAGERVKRPSEFKVSVETRDQHECPFCPGNEHQTPDAVLTIPETANGDWLARLIPNKFPAVDQTSEKLSALPIFHEVREGRGRHEVMIESRRHVDRQSQYSVSHFASLLSTYQSRIRVFVDFYDCQHVTVFTNVGYRGGATLWHPHSQIVGLMQVPQVIQTELDSAADHYGRKHSCVFCDMLKAELEATDRVIHSTADFAAIAPYASRFAYEFAIYPRRHCADFRYIDRHEIEALSGFLKSALQALDACLNHPDYNLILHTAPADPGRSSGIEAAFHWHFEVIPRVSTQAGMEWGTGVHINSFPPEKVAQALSKYSPVSNSNSL